MSQAEQSDGGLYRREMMRRTGAAAAGAMLLGAGASESDLSPVGSANAVAGGMVMAPTNPTRVSVTMAEAVGDVVFDDGGNTETALHQACMTAKEWWGSYYTIADNYLEDTATIASIEARNALATAFEDGEDASTARDDAHANIYEYYDRRLSNHIEVGRAVMQQIALQSATARNSGEFLDEFVATGVPSYSGSGSPESTYLVPADDEGGETVTYDLPSGETHETTMPRIVTPIDNGDQYEGPVGPEWIENYDSEAEETVLATDDGNELTGEWTVNIANVEEADLLSRSVFEPVLDFVDMIDRITAQADLVVGNYTQGFVEDLWGHLESGTITPSEVRGAAGFAQHMSGTSDVHDSRFRMALSAQLGVEQPDLSNTANMSVTYSGASATSRDVDPVEVYSQDFVDEQQYSGMLFGQDVPGVVSGSKVVTDPTVYTSHNVGSDSYYLAARDPASGEVMWKFDGLPKDIYAAGAAPDGSMAYAATRNNELHGIDPTDGSEAWVYNSGKINNAMDVSPVDGTVYLGNNNGEVHAVNPDGSAKWTNSVDGDGVVNSVSLMPDGSDVAAFATDGVYVLDGEDGSTLASNTSLGTSVSGGTVNPQSGEIFAVVLDDQTYVLDPSDASQKRSFSGTGFGTMEFLPDGSALITSTGSIQARDPQDGSTKWSYSAFPDGGYPFTISPDGSMIYAGGTEVHAISADGGTVEWTITPDGDGTDAAGIMQPGGSIAGMATNAYFFESATGDEITLRDGVLTVDSMQGSEGEEIEITTDETITYIEDADGRSIEEILAEIDEIDGVDDVTTLKDLELIVAEADGVDSVDELPINTQDWSAPEYDSYDSTEYVEYINKVTEEYRNALENSGGNGGGGGGPDWDWWTELLDDLGLRGLIPSTIFGIPTWMVLATGGVALLFAKR